MEQYYITTAIDYINGKPHIGHAYEKVAADVLARFERLAGRDVFFLTGTDEHGAKVAAFAEKQGMPIQEFADITSEYFKTAWNNLAISYSRFIRTTDADHIANVKALVSTMQKKGYIYEGEYTGLYCIGHEAFLTEKDLVDGLCPEHKTKPELVTERNYFLKVSAFTETIKEKIEANELIIWPQTRRHEVLSLLEQGFNDIAISRPNVSWGITLPWDETQTVYVWVDALINYITGVGFGTDEELFETFWPANWHVVGNDILKFHSVIWPAMLLAAGVVLPKGILCHGYLTIDNQKISKSLGNVIDPNDWVSKYGSDAVRYFLMREVAFGQDGDVSEEKLKARYTGDLSNGLGNLVSRVSNMVEKYEQGSLPDILTVEEAFADMYPDIGENTPIWTNELGLLIGGFKFHEALAKIWELVAWCNAYIDQQKPWALVKTEPAKVTDMLNKLGRLLLVIAQALAPFMPEAAERIRQMFEGSEITKINDLFPKVE